MLNHSFSSSLMVVSASVASVSRRVMSDSVSGCCSGLFGPVLLLQLVACS